MRGGEILLSSLPTRGANAPLLFYVRTFLRTFPVGGGCGADDLDGAFFTDPRAAPRSGLEAVGREDSGRLAQPAAGAVEVFLGSLEAGRAAVDRQRLHFGVGLA